MSLHPRNHGIVIGTDHFLHFEGERFLLGEVLRDADVRQHVTGLWVPRHVIDDDNLASQISSIAMGTGLLDYNSVLNKDKDGPSDVPKFRMIVDTSSSGGIDDILKHIEHIRETYPAPKMSFTVNIAAYVEGITALQEEYAHNKDVDFLLAGVYPENSPESILRSTKMTEKEYTSHLSELARELGMAGVVGYGGLARYTQVGQYYLAMGVRRGGSEQHVRYKNNHGREIVKRTASLDDTYQQATDTEILLSRDLFPKRFEDSTPESTQSSREGYIELASLIKNNIKLTADRLRLVPEPHKKD